MRAELVMIGTELLLGEVVDTNACFLARQLAECGLDVYYKSTVGDNLERAAGVLRLALSRADLVLLSGGLGPTEDDLTRELVAAVTGRELREDPAALQVLQTWFYRRYGGQAQLSPLNRKQAFLPVGSELLANPVGTAPGFWLEVEHKLIAALPGVPGELREMFQTGVAPRLRAAGGGHSLVRRNLRFAGIGEADLAERLQDLISVQTNPTIALYASGGQVRVRLAAKAAERAAALKLIEPLQSEIEQRTAGYFYGIDDVSLEQAVGGRLAAAGLKVVTAESCTGGMIAARLTDVPGSSAYFQRGYVVYSNKAKIEDLGVSAATLERFGAVSAETAREMAEGARRKSGADFALAITGIAGPAGGSEHKPVGLVYISLARSGDTIVQRRQWQGTRQQIRKRATLGALHLLWQAADQ